MNSYVSDYSEDSEDNEDNDDNAPSPYPPPGWTSLPNMSTPRANAGGVGINGHQFLVIGGTGGDEARGINDSNFLSSCEYFDTRTGTWNDLGLDLPDVLVAHGTAFVGDKVFVMGGLTGHESRTARNNVLALTVPNGDLSAITEEQSWESLPPMSQARFWFGCASDDRFIYVFGGHTETGDILYTAERFDTETYEWTSLPNVPTDTVNSFGAAMVGDKIFLLRGNGSCCVDVFNVSRREWNLTAIWDLVTDQHSPGTSKTSHSVVAALDRFLVVLGGIKFCNFAEDLVIDTAGTTESGEYHTLPTRNQGPFRLKCVAGVLEGDGNEVTIIVAGGQEIRGSVSNRAESISLITGILPPRFRNSLFDSWLFDFLRNDYAYYSSLHES